MSSKLRNGFPALPSDQAGAGGLMSMPTPIDPYLDGEGRLTRSPEELSRRGLLKIGIGMLASLAVGEVILLHPHESAAQPRRRKRRRRKNDYRRAHTIPTVCMNCSSACGMIGYVIDGELVKVGGNPEDPNCGKTLCAKGQSTPTINYYPERLLYPMRRVGRRGQGLWQRVTWDQALEETARRIRQCLDAGHPEWVAIHVGRNRLKKEVPRFLNAVGSPVYLNHRALCSLNKRAANYATVGDVDWESVDAERCKYFLNFGSNFYEAHQGSIHFLKRVIRGRFDNGAKLVTFDVRLSNTAGRSDEWFAPFPGTEGAIALAMAHVIVDSGEYDLQFVRDWVNVSEAQLREFLRDYTPAWAEKVSGIPAADITRIALEFIRCRPRCAAFTNRGSHAHYNGFNNDRAVVLLNALAGSIQQAGGYCWPEKSGVRPEMFPEPSPKPPKTRIRSILVDPPDYPLANYWQRMRVGELVYAYLQERRATLKVYLTYTLGSPTTWPEGRTLAVDVLCNEQLIPWHVNSDVVYSETAHYADLVLPDATYTERWCLDSRNNYELRHYVTLRQPVVPPPAECKDFGDVLIQLGKRCGPQVAKYYPFDSQEEFVRHQCRLIPPGDCKDGFEYMKKHGVWTDRRQPKSYNLFRRRLTPKQLRNTRVDEETGVIYRRDPEGRESPIGIMVRGVPRRGFKTPSRKFEVLSDIVRNQARRVGFADDGWPRFIRIPHHRDLPEDRFILTTFKWNVHTQARTAPQKYLSEIVHSNPAWINSETARRLGIRSGDWIEITTYRPLGQTYQPTGARIGSVRVRAFVTEGIHPRVVAVSNSLGHHYGGRAAQGRRRPRPEGPGFDAQLLPEDPDLSQRIWWDEAVGGTGNGWNINGILPIAPSPVTGMQSWMDTVCTVRKVEGA